MRPLIVGLLSLLLLLSNALAQLLICGSCGREADAGTANCAHCGAALSARPADAPVVAPPGATASPQEALGQTAFAAAGEDVAAARAEEERRPAVALARYENARALLALAPPDSLPPDAMRVVLDGVQRCRAQLTASSQECPACAGTGRKQIVVKQLAGTAATQQELTRTSGATCPACQGSGRVRQQRTVEQTRLLILQGRREAVLQQQALGRVTAGRAWVPPAWLEEFTPAQISAVRRILAAECSACVGLGLESCRTCQGSGTLPCRNRLCRQGWIEETPSNVLAGQSALKRKVKCPDCHGTARIRCTSCRGTGGIACRRCKGSGLAQPCRACGGNGTVACTLCRNQAARGVTPTEPCPQCKGTQQMFCGTCRGDGFQSR